MLLKVVSNGGKCPFRWDKISLFAGETFSLFRSNISTVYSEDFIFRGPIARLTKAYSWNFMRVELFCLAEHHHTLAWFFLEFFFLGKLKFYSQKTVINRINFHGWFCKTGRKNFHNNIKKLNLRKGLSNDISGLSIHHGYPKISAKTYKKAV